MNADRGLIDAFSQVGADCVYMLLHGGWQSERRSNRWHYAVRWARHLPVVLVCPETLSVRASRKPEPRIENCHILEVTRAGGPQWDPQQLCVGQILSDMKWAGFSRPLLWLYNPMFAEAFSLLPAAARIHHFTENYFEFDSLPENFLARLKFVIRMADLNVAVSEGCAKPLREVTAPEKVTVATNGCDFTVYGAEGPPDAEIAALRQRFSRVAVFAGNINTRIDYELMAKVADACPDTVVLFMGDYKLAAGEESPFAELLRRPNVRYLPPVAPERLPAIYRAADLGFVPYVRDKLMKENTYPLKTLEMAATGLPVVNSLMLPLLANSPPLIVARDDQEFIDAFARARREPAVISALRKLAAASDYDIRFADVVKQLAKVLRHTESRLSDLAAVCPAEVAESFLDLVRRDSASWRHAAIRYPLLVKIVMGLRGVKAGLRRLLDAMRQGFGNTQDTAAMKARNHR